MNEGMVRKRTVMMDPISSIGCVSSQKPKIAMYNFILSDIVHTDRITLTPYGQVTIRIIHPFIGYVTIMDCMCVTKLISRPMG
jgi:hypothetical protein